MVHQRSIQNLQKRDARRFILDTSFHDPIMAETISRANWRRVIDFLKAKYTDGVDMSAVDVVRGEVLIDSRGRGSFQK